MFVPSQSGGAMAAVLQRREFEQDGISFTMLTGLFAIAMRSMHTRASACRIRRLDWSTACASTGSSLWTPSLALLFEARWNLMMKPLSRSTSCASMWRSTICGIPRSPTQKRFLTRLTPGRQRLSRLQPSDGTASTGSGYLDGKRTRRGLRRYPARTSMRTFAVTSQPSDSGRATFIDHLQRWPFSWGPGLMRPLSELKAKYWHA